MNVGELFVSLGVKGSEKTVGAIAGVRKGLEGTASSGLAAKAAIVGAMYALERLFATSGAAGTGLTNFNALLGTGAKLLQQYQYAGRQVGATNEETEATFVSLSKTAGQIVRGEARPVGLSAIMLSAGIDMTDVYKAQAHPEILFDAIQKYMQTETVDIGLRNRNAESMGIGGHVETGMIRNGFTQAQFDKAPKYSDKEIAALDRANIAWSNLSTTIQMAIGHFNALHGEKIAAEITKIVGSVVNLSEKFLKLAEKGHAFEWINRIFTSWGMIFDGIGDVIDAASALMNPNEKKGQEALNKTSVSQNMKLFFGEDVPPGAPKPYTKEELAAKKEDQASPLHSLLVQVLEEIYGRAPDPNAKAGGHGTEVVHPVWRGEDTAEDDPIALRRRALRLVPPPSPTLPAPAAVAAPRVAPTSGSTQNNDVTINQTFTGSPDNPAVVARAATSGTTAALRASPAQAGGQ